MTQEIINHTRKLLAATCRGKPTVILGLSGGPDSVFLLHILNMLAVNNEICLLAAHLNHEWRNEAAAEAQFCKNLCSSLSVTFFDDVARNYVQPHEGNGSRENLGRLARTRFFETLAQTHGAQAIALAHHEQDQQETFFIRLIRGSSLSGLTGMKPITGHYIRPLLSTSKRDILAYLNQHAIAYCSDASNDSSDFLRNRIRSSVIPSLKSCDNRFERSFKRALVSLQETESFLALHTDGVFAALINQNELTCNLRDFGKQPALIQKRMLIKFLCFARVPFTPSSNHLQEMLRFLSTPKGGSHQLHTSWYLWKKQGTFGIKHNAPK